MNKIDKKVTVIREFINHPWKQNLLLKDNVRWDQLCASMDVIEDTQIAIEYYKKLEDFDAYKGGYLFLYGLLQAFFLQQDALNHLSIALFEKKINFKKDYPDLYVIRELRNDAIGHPTNRNRGNSFHYISQISISKNSFTLASYFPKSTKSESREIMVKDLEIQQEKNAIKILNDVINLLEQELISHRAKFKNSKLKDIVPQVLFYSISKIYEGIYSNYPLAKMKFDIIIEAYEKIKKGINERYGSYEVLPGVKDVFDKLDHIVTKLQDWFSKNNIYQNKDAEIFVDALKNRFKELIEMLDGIDDEFKQV